MFNRFRSSFGFRSQNVLTEDQMRRFAPSIFAEGKHESRSERYTYIPTWQVLQGLMREGFEPVQVVQGRTRVEGKADFTKHLIKLRHASAIKADTLGQEIPEITLINSHDGTSSYEFIAGFLRLACLNGLMVSAGTLESVKVAHRGDIVDNVIEGAFTVINQFDSAIQSRDAMKALTLDSNEQRIFARAALVARFGTDEERRDEETGRIAPIPVTVEQALTVRRAEDRDSSLWTTFNRVQETTVRGGLRHAQLTQTGRRNRTREVTGISENVRLNRALWQLADEMRALKGGERIAA